MVPAQYLATKLQALPRARLDWARWLSHDMRMEPPQPNPESSLPNPTRHAAPSGVEGSASAPRLAERQPLKRKIRVELGSLVATEQQLAAAQQARRGLFLAACYWPERGRQRAEGGS
jgi:hypothetical protein